MLRLLNRERQARAPFGLALAGLLAVAATGWQVVAPPHAVAAQSGLMYTSHATWTPDPKASCIHVDVAATATSRTADTPLRRYFFTGLLLQLPPSSTAFRADQNGEALGTRVESESQTGVFLFVEFGQRLYSGQSMVLDVHFDIVDKGGSTARDLRAGQNLFSFPVRAFGSPGTRGSSVSVVFPAGFIVQQEFGDLVRSTDTAAQIVYTSGTLDDATALDAWFTASKPVPPEGFLARQMRVGPLDVTLRYWSDDPGWAEQVGTVIQDGYPILRDLIGLGDVSSPSLVVEEAASLSARGLGGEYYPDSGVAQVSYFADPFVILHEMAHLWFNSDLARDRWIDEAFASYYAEQTVLRLGLPDRAPQLTERILRSKAPLNDWVTTGPTITGTDEYFYAGALKVATEIAAIAGLDGLRDVWVAIKSGQPAYQPLDGSANRGSRESVADWRSLLDQLEQRTGRSYAPIWRSWVVGQSDVFLLDERDRVRTAYRDALGAAGDWELPSEIRSALEDWRFSEAESMILTVNGVLAQRNEIAVQAVREGTTPPASLRYAFENLGVAAAAQEAAAELAALDALAQARLARSSGGTAPRVGLLGADPEADLAAARAAFSRGDVAQARSLADQARAVWEGAAAAALVRLVGLMAALFGFAALALLGFWARRRRQLPGASVSPGPMTMESQLASVPPARRARSVSSSARGAGSTDG
jgi:hypothetical protein